MRTKNWTLVITALAMAFALAGCSNDDDSAPNNPPIDTAPPTLPSGLSLSYDAVNFTVAVNWNANTTDADCAGYLVSRTVSGVDEDLVTEPQIATTYVDDVMGLGRQIAYRVYAVDDNGNVSAAAAAEMVLPTPQVDFPVVRQ